MTTDASKAPAKFPRELRLLDSKDFAQVFKKPVRIANKAFTILATPNHSQSPRLGLAIAKKQVKLAVNRNLIKRKLRESFRTRQATLPSFDFVVMVRRDINSMDRKSMESALSHIWRKVEKVCKDC
ncbi:ribonuclease P protein component [Pleionea sp. CnH1-48]|uniref:ribonuclease P protein component n=1 Tax=Pleionea sp. CnH1-48 TaxID=2954494 RepID=UPI0020971878|nr:ribonuclease P protein component [Pleionea sp. CnH1-48]MCO7226620.1 ribonuclease P protein component [Pleionea sp. CnH1-48]